MTNKQVAEAFTEGATMYCSYMPCFTCAKMIAMSGIKEIVVIKNNTKDNTEMLKFFKDNKVKVYETYRNTTKSSKTK